MGLHDSIHSILQRKAFKIRLKPKPQHRALFAQFAGCSRFIWNKALHHNRYRLEHRHPILRYQALSFWLTLWKSSEDYGFLKDCHSQILQQKLKDLDRAYADGFDKQQPQKKLPVFKKKGQQADSFRFPQGFKLQGNPVYLPKVGWLRFHRSRDIVGTVKNMTVSREGSHWFVSIQTEMEHAVLPHPSQARVGIDRGVTQFAALSTGKLIAPLNSFKTLSFDLARAQRALSRKRKFSKNWQKQKTRIQNLHRRIAHARRDFLHQCSTRLSKNYAMIVLEDLKIENMTRSASGTLDSPGHNVSAKSGLNRAILDQGWAELARQLLYKQAWLGGEVLFINPRYTSQTCPGCTHRSADNRKTQSAFRCVACDYQGHADIVAAINIERAGHVRIACGDIEVSSPQAQEPLSHNSADTLESSPFRERWMSTVASDNHCLSSQVH